MENGHNYLIHGNNSSTPHKQGLRRRFDDFNPDYSTASFLDRLLRYADAHSRSVEMSKYLLETFPSTSDFDFKRRNEIARSIATELSQCGSYLVFHHFHTIKQIKLASMCSCKRHLLCPLCAIRRAAKSVKVYLEKYNLLVEGNKHLVPYLVTFTVKDGDDLNERFEHLQSSLRKLYANRRRSQSSKSRHKLNQSCKALGGVGSFEIKRGSGSGAWHPHSHFIWLCESAPDPSALSSEWREITKDSFIVDVTPFASGKDVSGGFLEVFKYALKYSSMSLSDNWDAFCVLQRRRLVSSFGIFYGMEIPEQMTDEISYDDLPYIELVYRFFSGSYKLCLSADQHGNERSE